LSNPLIETNIIALNRGRLIDWMIEIFLLTNIDQNMIILFKTIQLIDLGFKFMNPKVELDDL